MAVNEEIEKLRQAVMRYRELLDILRVRMGEAERAYERLFDGFTPEERAETPVKALQWRIAEALVSDRADFGKAILQMRFDAREMEREFEALYDRLVEPPPEM